MRDKLFSKLYKKRNLEIALRRIQSAQNISYKNYYRELFFAYELSKDENLTNLSERIKNSAFKPKEPVRFYVPKSSGLQRTISHLYLDDVIVYQAFANVLADKFYIRRKKVENKTVYSHILNSGKDKDIFFFEKWQTSYKRFQNKTKEYYKEGNKWIANFDLAAYYDTINHQALCYLVSSDSDELFVSLLEKCLECWSSSSSSKKMKQGIPQGPLSSNLIGEIYMLPIDESLQKQNIKYVRYVDDIKIFGKSREEVIRGVIQLERLCKQRGLIPQSKKYEIFEAKNITEAVGKMPSLTTVERKKIIKSEEEAVSLFESAISESSVDIPRISYVLANAATSTKLLKLVLGNINKHPELTDYFIRYLEAYRIDEKVGKYIYLNQVNTPSPFEYVEGKYWELLSKFTLSPEIKNLAMKAAMNRIKKSKQNYALKLGLYKMIASSENKLIFKWVHVEESAFIQAMVAVSISSSLHGSKEYFDLIKAFLKRSSYEPALVFISQLLFELRLDLFSKVPSSSKDDSGVINNTLGRKETIDSIGIILKNTYKTPYYKNWKMFLGKDFIDINLPLFLSEKSIYIDRNSWMGNVDSFNDLVFRRLIELLTIKKPSTKWPLLIDKNGDQIKYGSILNSCVNRKLILDVSMPIKEFHLRRNTLTSSHPKSDKTGVKNMPLNGYEQRVYIRKLKAAYSSVIAILESNLP